MLPASASSCSRLSSCGESTGGSAGSSAGAPGSSLQVAGAQMEQQQSGTADGIVWPLQQQRQLVQITASRAPAHQL